jgi:transcriptional regulator with XRE-family HTH domain
MTSRDIAKTRNALGMSQAGFAQALGVSALTVSQWETGYRRASSLAVRAIEMLRDLGSIEKRFIEMVERVFDRVNAECFGGQIKRMYKFQIGRRMKGTKASVLPGRRLVNLSRSLVLDEGDNLEAALRHDPDESGYGFMREGGHGLIQGSLSLNSRRLGEV